ncbi:MAG: epoxyqueuosine reductase [Sediminispirochaetaceae bacterium]
MAEITEKELRSVLSRNGIDTWAWVRLSEYPEKDREEESRLYRKWIAEGLHGGMDYLSRHAPLKYYPERILPGAETVLTMVFPYYQEIPVSRLHMEADRQFDTGRIARYAWGRDYHRVIRKKLKNLIYELRGLSTGKGQPNAEFRGFVDSGPLDERVFTARARLGHIGRNGLLINPRYGSWVFLAEIITTFELSASGEGRASGSGAGGDNGQAAEITSAGATTGCPPGCRRCRQYCPTGAIRPDGSFDARRCISYLTIEHDGPIPLELRPLIGDRFFGCDTCQEVCPLNRGIKPTAEPDFIRHIAGDHIRLSTMLAVRTRAEMERYFAGSPLMRLSVEQLLRNALVAAGNAGSPELLDQVRELLRHSDPMLAEHSRWAEKQISIRSLSV